MRSLKLFGAGLLSAFLVSAPFVGRNSHTPAASTISDVRAMSVNVVVADGEGSGVIFHSHGVSYCLTAAHVTEGIPFHGKVIVTQGDRHWSAILVNSDEVRDLALLRIEAHGLVGRSAHLAAPDAIFPVGTHLCHVGNVLGLNGSYMEGELSALERFDGEFSQSSIPCYPGSSGGGIFLTDGTLVGILTRGAGPGINFFIPARLIHRYLVENDLQWLFE